MSTLKKRAVFTVVTCVLAAFFLLSARSVHARLAREESTPAEYSYDYSWDTGKASVDALNVAWINGDIELKIGYGSRILVTERADHPLEEEEKLDLTYTGGTLRIKWEDNIINFALIENTYKKLVVTVPREVAESLSELKCTNTAGNIALESGFQTRNAEIVSASGDLELGALTCENAKLETVSGTVNVKGFTASKTLEASTTSGPVRLADVRAEEVRLHTVSGPVELAGRARKLAAESVNAAVSCTMTACPQKAELSSVSGGLTLAIPENQGFEVDYSSIAGSFSTEYPITGDTGRTGRVLYSKGTSSFVMKTTSGAMEIKKAG